MLLVHEDALYEILILRRNSRTHHPRPGKQGQQLVSVPLPCSDGACALCCLQGALGILAGSLSVALDVQCRELRSQRLSAKIMQRLRNRVALLIKDACEVLHTSCNFSGGEHLVTCMRDHNAQTDVVATACFWVTK